MQLLLNGEPIDIAISTVADLLASRGLDPALPGIAVAINGEVVPRNNWTIHPVREGDDVEIITAMQGG